MISLEINEQKEPIMEKEIKVKEENNGYELKIIDEMKESIEKLYKPKSSSKENII